MARSLGTYSEEVVREIYVSYVAILIGSIDRWAKPNKQDPLTFVLFKGYLVNISEAILVRFLYGPPQKHNGPPLLQN